MEDTDQYAIVNEVRGHKWKWIALESLILKFAVVYANLGYIWNEIKTLAMNKSNWNEFFEALSSS